MFYSETDRLIYTSPVGTKHDPLAVQRTLIRVSNGTINTLLDAWGGKETTDAARAAAEEGVVTAARVAFGFRPFDAEGGVLDAVVLETLCDFLEFLKKKGDRGPTPPR